MTAIARTASVIIYRSEDDKSSIVSPLAMDWMTETRKVMLLVPGRSVVRHKERNNFVGQGRRLRDAGGSGKQGDGKRCRADSFC